MNLLGGNRINPGLLCAGLVTMLPVSQVSATELEEIVVVATKREVKMQDVPITLTAISGEGLEKMGVAGMDQLTVAVPGMNFGRQNTATIVFLRGVGSNSGSPGNEASVATYIDGVYQPNARLNIDSFNDVERVEVLKGPQGTLFGRNATGGLLHIITKDPTQETEGRIKAGYGNFDTFEGSFYGSTGITDNLAANISVYMKDAGESFIDNPLPGLEYVAPEERSVRVKLLYTPSDKTTIKLSARYFEAEQSNFTVRQPLPGVQNIAGFGYSGDWYTIANNRISLGDFEGKRMDLQVRHSLSDIDIISVSGYARDDSYSPFDSDAGPTFASESISPTFNESFTQEVRLESTYESRLQWIAGMFYMDNRYCFCDYMNFSPSALTLNPEGLQIVAKGYGETIGMAFFGEAEYALTEQTNLVVGLRHNKDDLEVRASNLTLGVPRYPETVREDDFTKTTYRLGINHHFTDTLMLYATASRGYKSGVYNVLNAGATPPAPNALQPEVLDALEVGFKSDWLDGRLRLNGAIYHYDYKNLQLQTIALTTVVTANAAAATNKGAELELQAQATDNLSFNMGLAYVDATFDEYIGVTNVPNPTTGRGNVSLNGDFSGNTLFRTPEISYNATVNYLVPTDAGNFNINLTYYYSDEYFWDEMNRVREPSYSLINGAVSWEDTSETYKVSVWGRNLSDEEYSAYSSPSTASGDGYSPAEPRMYGVNLEYRF